MLTIYGVHRSRAFRNIWLANELGIAYRQVPVIQAYRLAEPLAEGAALNTASPEFREINPTGQVPSIDDDGLILHQSLAINLYLAGKHGGPLAPVGVAEEGEMMMWALFAATELESAALKIQQTYGSALEATPGGRQELDVAVRQLRGPFAVLDRHLAKTGFMVGDRFTVADLNTVEVVRYATSATSLFDANPNIEAWRKACHARPIFQRLWAERLAEPA